MWDIAFSPDPAQTFLIVPDGTNQQIWILRRDTLEVVSVFGRAGHWAGQFYGAHNIASDREGNLYITETYEGKRVQKFVYKGLGAPTPPTFPLTQKAAKCQRASAKVGCLAPTLAPLAPGTPGTLLLPRPAAGRIRHAGGLELLLELLQLGFERPQLRQSRRSAPSLATV